MTVCHCKIPSLAEYNAANVVEKNILSGNEIWIPRNEICISRNEIAYQRDELSLKSIMHLKDLHLTTVLADNAILGHYYFPAGDFACG